MEMGSSRSVEDIFKDYSARRSAILRALTHDVDEFYGICDPEKENLCLYGHPNESWEVTLPAEEVPPELPEPALGINFARDGMNRKDWLSLVAVHSDCWLLSVSFYLGARLNRGERSEIRDLAEISPRLTAQLQSATLSCVAENLIDVTAEALGQSKSDMIVSVLRHALSLVLIWSICLSCLILDLPFGCYQPSMLFFFMVQEMADINRITKSSMKFPAVSL
ncbi:PHD finger protein ALFIN-LIKE 2-like protein [Tanacetum coccineum]